MIDRVWVRLCTLPTWLQVMAWITLGPFVAALALWRLPKGRIPARVTAVVLVVFFLPAYAAAFSDGPSTAPSVAREHDDDRTSPSDLYGTAAVDPSLSPVAPASQSPSPTAPATPHGVPNGAQRGLVDRIVDGDTLWVRIDEPGGALRAGASHKIRVLEIDSPETVAPGQPVECFGPEASTFATAELPVGSVVYLLDDEEDRDRYGRFLRYVWDADGEFYNHKAVRLGYATAALYAPNDRFIELMREGEREAKAARRGLWGTCPASVPLPTPSRVPAPAASSTESSPAASGTCHPSYEGTCIPVNVSDADCAGGSGNGPYYVHEEDVRVVGPDAFGLDADGDGVACRSR
jgi:micrococcal nuclease